ncbi:MAG: STAS/SEC14 domain-containing protein [Gemmatimonadota bacterium]
MLERIVDLPDHVLGFKATGRVTADDYESILVPAVEKALSHHQRVRLLYLLGDGFEGFTGAAAWEDAKVGLRHFTRFDRVAVVTSVDWIRHSVKAFGFIMPGEVRVFESNDLSKAREWISEPAPTGDMIVEFLVEQGVLILHPAGELAAADFERVSRAVDPYLEKKGALTGVMIVAEHFPGWDDLGALAAHVRFVRDHHEKVKRLAIVSNDPVMSAMPYLARHFLVKESRHYPFDERDQALAWVSHE